MTARPPPQSTGRRVFVSYSRADSQLVAALVQGLVARGHDPWIDIEDITSGSWAASIVEAIKGSDVAVVVLTPTSVDSRNVLQEVRLAAKHSVPLIPVVVRPPPVVPGDIEYHITGEQRVDVDPANIPAAVRSLVLAVEGSTTKGAVEKKRRLAGCLAGLAIVGALAFGGLTVVTGKIPPWGPTPACSHIAAEVASTTKAEFVTLKGAVLDIAFRNDTDRQVGLPFGSDVQVTGRGGFDYRQEESLAQPGGWFGPESVAPHSTKSLKVAIATQPGRGPTDRVTVIIPGVSDSPVPFLHCEVVIPGVDVELAT